LKKWESSIKAFSFNFKTTGDFNEVLKKTQTLKKKGIKKEKAVSHLSWGHVPPLT